MRPRKFPRIPISEWPAFVVFAIGVGLIYLVDAWKK